MLKNELPLYNYINVSVLHREGCFIYVSYKRIYVEAMLKFAYMDKMHIIDFIW